MIFDDQEVTRLYLEYVAAGGDELVCRIHDQTDSLIRSIAASVCWGPEIDDLVQEGHLKLHSLVTCQRYDPGRGSTMYNFLSQALRNHMLDFMRKCEDTEELPEDDDDGDDLAEISQASVVVHEVSDQSRLQAVRSYELGRYPSLPKLVVEDAVDYVIHALTESACGGYKGIIRTLQVRYGLERRTATTMYYSTMAVLRMTLLGLDWVQHIGRADVNCGNETSLLPEMTLMLGDVAGTLRRVFAGSYVKF